jgi:hypothetical protein
MRFAIFAIPKGRLYKVGLYVATALNYILVLFTQIVRCTVGGGGGGGDSYEQGA